MTPRLRAWLAVLVATAVAVACVGCSDDDDGSRLSARSTTSTTVAGDPTQLPRAFVSGADDGWAMVGATDAHVVGLGGPAADDERFGQTFDLETGAVADIPIPPFDEGREVRLERAAFGASTVVVGAFAYEGGIDPDEVDITTGEPYSTLITYRLDPAAKEWTRVPLPAPYTETPRLTLKSLDPVGSDGAVALLDGGITQEAVLAVLEDDEWAIVGEGGFTDPFASSYCATDTTFWQLDHANGAEALVPLALDDGAVLPVRAPTALTDADWELSVIGCTADAVVLATSNPDERPMVHVSTDGLTWVEQTDPFGPGDGFLSGTVSGARAVMIHVGGMEAEATGHVVVADAEVIDLDDDAGFLAWRGRTASYLSTPAFPPGEAPDEPTIALRTVDLP